MKNWKKIRSSLLMLACSAGLVACNKGLPSGEEWALTSTEVREMLESLNIKDQELSRLINKQAWMLCPFNESMLRIRVSNIENFTVPYPRDRESGVQVLGQAVKADQYGWVVSTSVDIKNSEYYRGFSSSPFEIVDTSAWTIQNKGCK